MELPSSVLDASRSHGTRVSNEPDESYRNLEAQRRHEDRERERERGELLGELIDDDGEAIKENASNDEYDEERWDAMHPL